MPVFLWHIRILISLACAPLWSVSVVNNFQKLNSKSYRIHFVEKTITIPQFQLYPNYLALISQQLLCLIHVIVLLMDSTTLTLIIQEFRSSNICFKVYDATYTTFFSEEAVRSSASPMTKSSIEMENHVFQKAKTRVGLQTAQ